MIIWMAHQKYMQDEVGGCYSPILWERDALVGVNLFDMEIEEYILKDVHQENKWLQDPPGSGARLWGLRDSTL